MDLISIVVPIYKVEKYLEDCICSLVHQTYENLEIILVDDGSPDDCGHICDQWAKKDKRIRVLHKENGGLSDARNAGAEIARGDFIGFVDSDDVVHPKMYEFLYRMMKETNSDIGCCDITKVIEQEAATKTIIPGSIVTKEQMDEVQMAGVQIVEGQDCPKIQKNQKTQGNQEAQKNQESYVSYNQNEHDKGKNEDSSDEKYDMSHIESILLKTCLQTKESRTTFSATEAIASLLKLETITVTVWNKLYKKELLDSLKFPKGKYHEDEFWTYRVLDRANRVAHTNMPYYGYRLRSESITTQKYTSRHLDFLDGRGERLEYMEEKYPQFQSLERTNMRFECIRSMQLCYLHMEGEELKTCKERIYRLVKKYPVRRKDYKMLPIGRQVWCLLSNVTFDGTCKLRNALHYGP